MTIETVQKLVSSLSDSVVTVNRSVNGLGLTLGVPDTAPLQGPARLRLRVRMQFWIEDGFGLGPWETKLVAYSYSLRDPGDREVLAYQWHPTGPSPITYPHLHLGPGAQVERRDLAKAHLPTGPVGLQEFLRLLIVDLSVRPRRRDWSVILAGQGIR